MTPFWIALTTTIVVIAGLLVIPLMISFTRKQIATRRLMGALGTPAGTTTAGAGTATASISSKTSFLSTIMAGTVGRMSMTLLAYLVLGMMIVMFNLLPADLILYFSGIIMLILGGMALLSLVMLITGWGNLLAWGVLLAGFGILMFNPPETTTTWVTETTQTIQEEGLRGVGPKVTPMVPDIIYMSPEEKAAARKAEAEELKRQQELGRIQAEGEARARVAAETAAARALEESMMDAKAVPCVRKYTEYGNCMTVTFGVNTKYDRELIKGHCLVSDPVSALTRTSLGGYQYRYTGQPGLVAQFFDLPIGQTVGTFTCES